MTLANRSVPCCCANDVSVQIMMIKNILVDLLMVVPSVQLYLFMALIPQKPAHASQTVIGKG
jgi:hypothetical protein